MPGLSCWAGPGRQAIIRGKNAHLLAREIKLPDSPNLLRAGLTDNGRARAFTAVSLSPAARAALSLRGRAVTDATAASPGHQSGDTASVAVVGLACRFPDADDPAALLDVVLTGRRAFRRLPPGRIDLADYYQRRPGHLRRHLQHPGGADRGLAVRAARRSASSRPPTRPPTRPTGWRWRPPPARWPQPGCPQAPAWTGTAPASSSATRWPATPRGPTRCGVRWPYVRRVLTEALGTQATSRRARRAGAAAAPRAATWPRSRPWGRDSLAGSMPGTIAAAISSYFGFRGGSHAVDSACSSSLQAVASACTALAAGDLDAAIAGGVDISLDPLELIGLAKAGVLATGDVRDLRRGPDRLPARRRLRRGRADARRRRPRGRPARLRRDPRLGHVRRRAQRQRDPSPHASSQLLAMQRAYERAQSIPRDIQLIEGNGAGTAAADEAELSALSRLRAGARQRAALGSVKANIGHAKAAAGAAGLIKTVLALGTGVVPPPPACTGRIR